MKVALYRIWSPFAPVRGADGLPICSPGASFFRLASALLRWPFQANYALLP
jgi:hypothetical protein